MKFFYGSPPKRKSKPKDNPMERDENYLKLRGVIAGGKMRPKEQAHLILDGDDGKRLGLKYPARTATDQLRRFIKSMRLESEYRVHKYETNTPGSWAVVVTYDPPMTTSKHAVARRKESA